MESLALLAALIVVSIYSSAFISFGLSWLRNKPGMIATFVFAIVGFLSGLWVWITLAAGNGVFIGSIPMLISAISVWNTLRRNRK